MSVAMGDVLEKWRLAAHTEHARVTVGWEVPLSSLQADTALGRKREVPVGSPSFQRGHIEKEVDLLQRGIA
jgi:hypothetical protein